MINDSKDVVVDLSKLLKNQTNNSELLFKLNELEKENEKLKERLEISPYGDDKIDELEQALSFAKHEIVVQNKEIRELKDKIIKLTNAWLKHGEGERKRYEL